MKVLILGASGYIGSRLYERLSSTGTVQPRRTSHRELDTCDCPALTRALAGIDCVINCVAGDYRSIAIGARELARAAEAAKCSRIVHFSSMAAYGRSEGLIAEGSALDPGLGWYARAKCQAEGHISAFAQQGGQVVTLRPGCLYGPGSELWVGRVGRWLRDGRVGDLGTAGDGWSNLVHIDDVCEAVARALSLPVAAGCNLAFNLAAPDSPRWNVYLRDLGIAIQATPVRRVSARRLRFDSAVLGPPLKILERLMDALRRPHEWLPDPLPPSVVHLWEQDIRLNASAATEVLGLNWTSYEAGLEQSARWFLARYA
jgi:nucleoside-diphosphate-sugar epimerase